MFSVSVQGPVIAPDLPAWASVGLVDYSDKLGLPGENSG